MKLYKCCFILFQVCQPFVGCESQRRKGESATRDCVHRVLMDFSAAVLLFTNPEGAVMCIIIVIHCFCDIFGEVPN